MNAQGRRLLWMAIAAVLLWAAPAAAQAPPAPMRWYIGGMAGGQAVQTLGGQVGGELGVRLNDRIEIFGEAAWLQNVITRRRIQTAQTVAAFLQQTQGSAASATISAPAGYGGAGVRVMLTDGGSLRPYVIGEAGVARVTLRPAFMLGGTNVTTQLPQYGVTLGSDLTGQFTKSAFGAGAGVLVPRGTWYIDGSVRLTSIRTDGQPTNVIRFGVGIGRRF
jgi:hypothetical protein